MQEEKFKLWRLALGCIHTDGKVTAEEETWFLETLKRLDDNKVLNFKDEQIAELKKILVKPIEDFQAEFEKLTSPADCAMLVHYLNIISNVDGELAPEEKQRIEKLQKSCLRNVDIDTVQIRISKLEKDEHSDELDNPSSIFERAFKSLFKLLSPGPHN